MSPRSDLFRAATYHVDGYSGASDNSGKVPEAPGEGGLSPRHGEPCDSTRSGVQLSLPLLGRFQGYCVGCGRFGDTTRTPMLTVDRARRRNGRIHQTGRLGEFAGRKSSPAVIDARTVRRGPRAPS